MEIDLFEKRNLNYAKKTAELLIENFPHSYSSCAVEEIEKCLFNIYQRRLSKL